MATDSRDVLARIEAEKGVYLEELKDYIRIPSISTDPQYKVVSTRTVTPEEAAGIPTTPVEPIPAPTPAPQTPPPQR